MAWQRDAERALTDYHRLLRQAKAERTPKAPGDGIDAAFAEACRHLDYAAYALEWLGDDAMDFYRRNRDYIAEVKHRLGNI